MKTEKVLILGREDLIACASDVKISHISISDFKGTVANTFKLFTKQNMIIFVEKNGETRILKNRWGDTGKIIRRRRYGRT